MSDSKIGILSRWIDTTGGPLIVMPQSIVHQWKGIDEHEQEQTDYSWACETNGFLKKKSRYQCEMLILNDQPLPTSQYHFDEGLLLIRWLYAPDQETMSKRIQLVCNRWENPSIETSFLQLNLII
jgi:hypothetical protein